MTDVSPTGRGVSLASRLTQLVARPSFQDWVSRVPGLSRIARKDGEALFDVVQGFVRSQVLFALVQLGLPKRLMRSAATADQLATEQGIAVDRMTILLKAGVGIGILKLRKDGTFAVSRKGAALTGVPGLNDMILHHGAFYRDMLDPVGLLNGNRDTELSAFWPYVYGADGAVDPAVTDRYSNLMADTQALVARDTLQTVSLDGITRLMDVGGGSGAFLIEVAKSNPEIDLILFDLPTVADAADRRIAQADLTNRIAVQSGSFRDDPLPQTADAISLVRVLYDHGDDTVKDLLASVWQALPNGGRLIVSEPMSGGGAPDPITDVYFAFYTLAMRTGRTRSAEEISTLLRETGFSEIQAHRSKRPYVTSVVSAQKIS